MDKNVTLEPRFVDLIAAEVGCRPQQARAAALAGRLSGRSTSAVSRPSWICRNSAPRSLAQATMRTRSRLSGGAGGGRADAWGPGAG
jgi:hypothetical protein